MKPSSLLHRGALLALLLIAKNLFAADTVEQWGVYEIALKGPTSGNPFLDVNLSATFTQGAIDPNHGFCFRNFRFGHGHPFTQTT